MNEQQEKLKNDLYKEMIKLSKRANQRILSIERQFGKETWAIKKLKNRLSVTKLNAWTKKGRISLKKDINITQIRAITKATEQFLASKTSTLRGIKEVKEKQVKGIKQAISIDNVDLPEKYEEILYNFFNEDYANDILQYIPSSDILGLITDSYIDKDNKKQFLKKIENYVIVGNDINMRNSLTKLYNKYIKRS